jgi:hypothetical protein
VSNVFVLSENNRSLSSVSSPTSTIAVRLQMLDEQSDSINKFFRGC